MKIFLISLNEKIRNRKGGENVGEIFWYRKRYLIDGVNVTVKPKSYFEDRKCCECGSPQTTQGFGSPRWHVHKCHKEKCTGYLCHKCYSKIQNRLPDSYDSIIKLMRQCRNRYFDMTKNQCKGCIGAETVAKTLCLKNLNIETDNFNSDVDLSKHDIYGYVEVKTSSLIGGKWQFEIKYAQKIHRKFDTVVLVCMDYEWEDVLKVYIIPIEKILSRKGSIITIYEKCLRCDRWYDEFIVKEKPYNDVFHTMVKGKCPYVKKSNRPK